ncbi:hypothetical protein SAMN05443245_5216 [Paraburkholderia fungorum]|uniref:Uncharacterized protein n=1 Tax=Paraburkholderia fungorum TaxID=134537 RepID=A0A1H1II67_9BURK|nr:hypothetical protein [Paraburkholderia fungorum]SDR37370.1 hypothetical protein SAMN05443245_5216 [Paraburkholderia fungorum]
MSRSQKPRKKYNPTRFIERIAANAEKRRDANPLTDDQQRDLGLAYHIAFENMLKRGNEEDWYILASTMNVALVLAEKGYGEEFIPEVKAAMEAMMDAKYRADRTGRWAFDGAGIQAMRVALELHDQQCAMATRAEIKVVLQAIIKRANEGHMYAAEQCHLEAA